MIKTSKSILAALVAVGLLSVNHRSLAEAGDTDTALQVVNIQVNPINVISVTGTPSLQISTAVAGDAPNIAVDTSATYAVTTNEDNRKISASIEQPLPPGLHLLVTLAAPTDSASLGERELETTAIDLVTGITRINESNLPIIYKLIATSQAAPVNTSALVTYTITAGAE
jgi:hypothetical protein